jgi:hypothetical protein
MSTWRKEIDNDSKLDSQEIRNKIKDVTNVLQYVTKITVGSKKNYG